MAMKKAFIISYLILFFFILATCAQKVEDQVQILPVNAQVQVDLVKAKQMIESACISCHSATASMENRLAPPLEAVKRRYLRAYPDIEEFTTQVAAYVAEPTEEKALMHGAVERFNLMTPIPYPEEDLVAIATYIYQFELDKLDWFEVHYQEMHGDGVRGKHGNGDCQGNGQKNQHQRGQGGS
jgi:cytochrome c553